MQVFMSSIEGDYARKGEVRASRLSWVVLGEMCIALWDIVLQEVCLIVYCTFRQM